MSIQTELERIIALRDELRIRMRNMGLVSQDADLEECVYSLRSIETHGHTFTPIESFDDWITISPGYYPEGSVVGIASVDQQKFIPENIKQGVTILGVTGTHSGTTLPTLNVPAYPEDVRKGAQYIDGYGNRQTGEMPSLAGNTLNAGDATSVGLDGATFNLPHTGYISNSKVKLSLDQIVHDLLDGADTLKAYIAQGDNPILRYGSRMLGGQVFGSYTSDATAVAANILSGKTAYVKGEKITGTIPSQAAKTITPSTSAQTAISAGTYATGAVTVAAMPTATQATPSISVSSTGLITASATQSAGYVNAGTKSATKQLTTKGATTFTPTTSDQTISSGIYLTGTQTIKGDSDLKASNIRKGVAIFGVTGTYEASGTSDFTPSNGATVNLRPSGQLDGTSVWCNYAIKPVGYTSDYAIFEYTLTAGLGSTSASTGSGHEEYSALIRFSGTNIKERTYCIIVKSWNTAWGSGSTAARFDETGYFAVPITGTPSSVTVLSRFKTTAVSNVASATGTVTF